MLFAVCELASLGQCWLPVRKRVGLISHMVVDKEMTQTKTDSHKYEEHGWALSVPYTEQSVRADLCLILLRSCSLELWAAAGQYPAGPGLSVTLPLSPGFGWASEFHDDCSARELPNVTLL